MRIVSFYHDQQVRLGILIDKNILDATAAAGSLSEEEAIHLRDAVTFIRGGAAAKNVADRLVRQTPREKLLASEDVRLAAPMMPSTILCAGSNYREHNAEKIGSPTSGKEPEFFLKTADCVVGPDEPIIYDTQLTRKLDCETELAIVIGKPGRHIPKADALEHVFGYTIANDVTARDRQVRRQGDFTWYELGRGKAFDSSAPLGPCIVTADEIPDPQHLAIKTRINGELRQSSNTQNMIWTCADLIHFFSANFTLKPGMIIITGTPAGTAWSTDKELGGNWKPNGGVIAAARYCLAGDRVESEVEKIGILRNLIL
jgi:2-keto-4-pentenoate hydratase/2-oxohepta-3-ene-1,7-dioic acid hydratase in catechol pathway